MSSLQMRASLCATALVIAPTGAVAQAAPAPAPAASEDSTQAQVKGAVQQYLEGLRAGDTNMMEDVSLTDGVNTSVRVQSDGGTAIRRSPQRDMISSGREGERRAERIWNPVVSRRGDMAVLWAPYEFELNGKVSHCGVDVFNLVKTEAGWKIASMMWTVEPSACEALGASLSP